MTEPVLEPWAEDIACLRLPMPAFGGVNAFILGQPGNQTIIDTGMPGAETAAIWHAALRNGSAGGVEAVFCTHAHIDHAGQVGLLARETGAPLLMSVGEYEDLSLVNGMTFEERQRIATIFQDKGGFPLEGRGHPTDYSVLAPLHGQVQHVNDGDTITLGGRDWEVMLGGGHSRAPVCLLSRDLKILLAGDQLLMGSGPQVPVQAERPGDDMLGAYFSFLDRLDTLPDDFVVFPGHGDPIHNFKQQVARIRNGHRQRLDRLLDKMDGAMTRAELASLVFTDPSSRLKARLPYLTTALTNYLITQSQILACDDAGILKYWRNDDAPTRHR
ncbi:Glyoxylase, beta-lactamase superfamily II [Devosia sp. YR412]|uniref:MBL fold metallo-hydrolase n=1 Tax=Devosia sp. YR412 TaxID=1881030 RepID=UPI0008CEF0C4|nr:MBL fold metallo-hydrolase [Devosia sp. YR412]SEQ49299.1 Glyoxylase, beta-lactamase superfamily II [Devosia sp. YR412]